MNHFLDDFHQGSGSPDNISVINKNDLANGFKRRKLKDGTIGGHEISNWSAFDNLMLAKGLIPHSKKGFIFTESEHPLPSDTSHYMSDETREELNSIGEQIDILKADWENIRTQVKTRP